MYLRLPLILAFFLLMAVSPVLVGQVTVGQGTLKEELYPGLSLPVLHDTSGNMTFDQVRSSGLFHIDSTKKHSIGVYWVVVELENQSEEDVSLVFTHWLTSYVHLFQLEGGQVVFEAKSGEMLKKRHRKPGESREYVEFLLRAGATQQLFIRLENTKDRKYNPPLHFYDKLSYDQEQESKLRVNFMLLGAAVFLAIYMCVLYLTSRYRPYFWLMWFSVFSTFYAFLALGYHIDWLLPDSPLPGKVLVAPVGQLIQVSMLMLLATFYNLREQFPRWFKVVRMLLGLAIVRVFVLVYVNASFQAFGLMINYTVISLMLESLVLIVMVVVLWKQIDKSQKIMGVGVLYFGIMVGLTLFAWMYLNDKSLAAKVGLIIPQIQVLTFTVAIGSKMKRTESDKNKAIQSFLNLRQELAMRIEQEVGNRTRELSRENSVISARKEKIETLFREANHRVKNNFQLLSSLLSMQEWEGADTSKMVEDSRNRIITMTVIHQFLYQNKDVSAIDFKIYCEELVHKIFELQYDQVHLELTTDFGENCQFDLDTSINLGLIVNELVTNTFKYAVPMQGLYRIDMKLERQDQKHLQLIYFDQGPSFDFDKAKHHGFGLRLISRLCRQLKGDIDYRYQEGNQFFIRFQGDF